MNEPGTHIEIEDVLTSIRRLVSQDASGGRGPAVPHRAAAPAVELPSEPASPEGANEAAEDAPCLVLTPALRVEPAETEAEAPVLAQTDEDIVEELSRLESSIAEMEAAVAGHDAELETEFGDAGGAEPEVADEVPTSAGPQPAEPSPVELRDDSEEIEAPFAEDVVPEELDALLLDMIEPNAAEYEDEVADLNEEVMAADEAMLAADLADAVEAGGDVWDEDDAEVEDGGDPDLRDDAWTEDQGAMDWAEAALNLASNAGQGPRRLHLSDALEEDRKPEILRSSYQTLRDEYARDEDLPGIEAALDDEPVMDAGLLDEEALRDLVAQLIREELRGVLGERITRNVRKLVRREIQRALMGEDYE